VGDIKKEIRRNTSITLELLTGCLKLLAILAPVWLPLLLIFGSLTGGNCRHDCAVGVGMLFVTILAIVARLAPLLLFIGLPLVLWLLYRWTHQRPVQFIGAVTFLPVLLVGWWSYTAIRDMAAASRIEAAMRPEYLSRTIAKPVGKLNHLIFFGQAGSCHRECYEVLANGFASKYSQGFFDKSYGQEAFEDVYSISSGVACGSDDTFVAESIDYLQSHGIFDSCIVKSTPDPTMKATVLRGLSWDPELLRPDGLRGIKVLQDTTGTVFGPEIVRWETGYRPGTHEPIGTLFQWQDLVRAYTGISTDRFADAERLSLSERVMRALRIEAGPPLQIYALFEYLRRAPDAFHYGNLAKEKRNLPDEEIEKLRALGARICAATPTVSRHSQSEPIHCVTIYNDFVRRDYPRQAAALALNIQ
jgi:hypothetical protein